ncbi:MAG: methylenetetrahydrofolate--tRNA-(uracil(54)-C(5))-methyltransferase (FADH(2)-oxidizing) TrmFO [Desulfarculaceae bacterium]|jgi:methylenetetrahydrofolate--tRNA-(uracil-5-)-methyltransferase
MSEPITIIGGGLAGCEAALQAAQSGVSVNLIDMKPQEFTPAHKLPQLGELVCSNSLRSAAPGSAVGLLKIEMDMLGSALMDAARSSQVAAGQALAVDRHKFSGLMEASLESQPLIKRICSRVDRLPDQGLTILATGPLTTQALAQDLARITGSQGLHFYDAIAPIVLADSVDMDQAFWADRYGKGSPDYLNCPLTKPEYQAFFEALTTSEQVPLHDFESPRFFEGCLPIEVMAARGPQTLTFGPMKPVGLEDPRSGRRPFAVVQLRKEDASGRLLNMVGFQTKLTHRAQERVFRLIPALAQAEFVRLGSIHRNTFLDAPRVLEPDLSLKAAPHILIAGQLSGVEGYVESAAMGILCGLNAARRRLGQPVILPPPTTALGGLLAHLANLETKDFQPSNVNFGLLPPLGRKLPKKERGLAYARRALADLNDWMNQNGLVIHQSPPRV